VQKPVFIFNQKSTIVRHFYHASAKKINL